jgi:putative Mg2+ transporter-C (MgtC) family protein
MFNLPDVFYDINIVSVTIRLVIAVIIGGIIGLERGANNHAAGFRTHILVCVGAALVMVTNEYICQFNELADPARLGAQVITGVGFLGAGTIMVTGRNKVKGLTTAAGLWASACLGLAIGIGFYEGALVAAILIFVSLALLPKVEAFFFKFSRSIDLYIEIDSIENFREFIKYTKTLDTKSCKTIVASDGVSVPGVVGFTLSMTLEKGTDVKKIETSIKEFDGIYLVEDI